MKCKPMSWAYLAGFFDGEGTLMARWSKNRHGGKSLRVTWQVGQNEENSWVLDEILEFFECDGRIKSPGDYIWANSGFSQKKFRQIRLEDAASIRVILEETLPYLIVKRGKAERVHDFLKKKEKLIEDGWSYAAREQVTVAAEDMMEKLENFLSSSVKKDEK